MQQPLALEEQGSMDRFLLPRCPGEVPYSPNPLLLPVDVALSVCPDGEDVTSWSVSRMGGVEGLWECRVWMCCAKM